MKVFIPLANGFEEIEAIATIDVLKRANIEAVTFGLNSTSVTSARGLQIRTDKKIDDMGTDQIEREFNAMVLIGGNPGYLNLGRSQKVIDCIKKFNGSGKLIGAICAAPSVLNTAGILHDKAATIYPGMEREIPRPKGTKLVVDDNIVTAQGPAVAIDFALKLVEKLAGAGEANKVRKALVC
jgi:4-methyl-5(b-hydroxyethyl)-thiazole monophosphate biosynthesis